MLKKNLRVERQTLKIYDQFYRGNLQCFVTRLIRLLTVGWHLLKNEHTDINKILGNVVSEIHRHIGCLRKVLWRAEIMKRKLLSIMYSDVENWFRTFIIPNLIVIKLVVHFVDDKVFKDYVVADLHTSWSHLHRMEKLMKSRIISRV